MRFVAVRPWLYLGPAVLLMLVWVYVPLGGVVGLSFMRWNLVGDDRPFVGLANYRRLVEEPEFANAAWNTVLYAVGLAPLVIVAPLGCAVVLWKHTGAGGAMYRTLLFMPVMVAPVVGAVIWQWILHPLLGVANGALDRVGIGAVAWLDTPALAIWALVVVTGWKAFGLSFILYSAALANIDRRYVEAAAVDGATQWEITRFVLVPLLAPTTSLIGILCLVFAGQWSFASINVLTQGGPQGATENLFSLLYAYGFRFFDTGAASATAVLLVVVFGAAATVQLRINRRWAGQDA